ncbi:hypothetical protein G9C98_002200 [Cotesia typhae]|uniref:Protein C10 n=1 Tax=Cotesia typhae TaxID=2053667 RepID=A0A8J5R6X4_9HYME|nr:hypothetical protein G9C98_002200 [Cotesia typhae]
MAQSRLERIGTIFTRVQSLLKSGAVKWEDKPIWYDVYEAFPPKNEPRYDRTGVSGNELWEKALEDFNKENTKNVQKLSEAKESSGNEMMKMMQFIFPIVTQIQMDVIKKYGFSEGREGTIQFAQFIRTLEREDPEIARLHNQVRSYFLPSVASSPSAEASL